MKKFILAVFSLVFSLAVNATVGCGAASLIGIPAVYGVVAGVGIPLLGQITPSGVLPATVYTEVWTGYCTKAFRTAAESIGWYNKIKSFDQYVENDVIHFVNLGGDPTVLVNNKTYPIGIESLEDADKPIGLDKYQTKATRVTDDELYAISYDKMRTVIERHRDAIAETKYARALHSIAPSQHAEKTPVLLTTGDNTSDGRKAITRKDIVNMKKYFDNQKIPVAGRMLVLCSDHVNDLLLTDQKFADQYYNYTSGKIANMYSFEVYEYTDCPYYTVASKEKKAFGAIPAEGDSQASVAFYTGRMMKANGSVKMYHKEAKTDPENQANLVNFRHYSICLPLKEEAMGAIVSDKAA